MGLVFQNPFYLWALLVIPLIILLHFISLKYSKERAIKFANFIALARVSERTGVSSNIFILILRILVLTFFILAISGTIYQYEGTSITADYVLAMDSSASMLATDLVPTRMDVAKETAKEFVDGLNPLYSSIAVISFSGTSFVHQFLTEDYWSVKDSIDEISVQSIGGTDVGNAIITSSNILLSSTQPRVIILVTDGRDNIGINQEDAIVYANENNVLIYTIGIGTEEGFTGEGDLFIGPLGINEEDLMHIANSTKGSYFNVRSKEDFQSVFDIILTSKKKKVSLDFTLFLLIGGVILLVFEWILVNTRFRIIP